MKILCAYSSITFSCEHFPATLQSRESYHPIFNLPQKKLLSYLGKYSSNGLTQTDSYLLFLSILNSTDLVSFRVPAVQSERTPAIIAQNIEFLAKVVSRLNTVTNPSVLFPRYVISPDTCTLDNVHFWIQNWQDSYQDFLDGYSKTINHSELARRESALERLIKNPHKPISAYSYQLAEWAATAGSFPTFSLISPLSGLQVSCTDYWKTLISKCANEDSIFAVRRKDLEELLEHCEENIPIGSGIFSFTLFKVLRHALERQKNFLGLGDLDIGKSTYEILGASDTTESANLKAMIQAAPEHIPRPEEYPSKLAYLKAKLRYDMAKKYSQPTRDL